MREVQTFVYSPPSLAEKDKPSIKATSKRSFVFFRRSRRVVRRRVLFEETGRRDPLPNERGEGLQLRGSTKGGD